MVPEWGEGKGAGGAAAPPALLPGRAKRAALPDKTDDKQESIAATRNILVIKVQYFVNQNSFSRNTT